MITFAISDIPGDNVGDIASGPTIPDATTQADALRILERYAYPKVAELTPVLRDPRHETPKPDDRSVRSDRVFLIASAATALDASRRLLERHGLRGVTSG